MSSKHTRECSSRNCKSQPQWDPPGPLGSESQTKVSAADDGEKWKLFINWKRNGVAAWKPACQLPRRLNTGLPHDLTIQLLNMYRKRLKTGKQILVCPYLWWHFSQKKVEMTQISINKWMDKQSVINTYNGILFSHKQSSDMCCNMDKPWKYYAKWNKPDTKGQLLYVSQSNQRLVEGENGVLLFNG